MPKIPTFTTQGSITAEPSSVTTNIQAPLSMASGIGTVQKSISDYLVKEQATQNKTEALELENQAIAELSGVVNQASKYNNKQQADSFFKTEADRIRNKYRDKASNRSVQSSFDNNFLLEQQKQIYKVGNAVSKNIFQSYQNQKSIKTERILTEGLYGKNPIQESQLINDLTRLEIEDTTQDDDTREKNIAAIPGKIDYFKAKRAITDDPAQALKDIRNVDDGPYKNLPLKARQQLESDALIMARPAVKTKAEDHLSRLGAGLESTIDHKEVKEILGINYYEKFAKTESIVLKTRNEIKSIYNSKIGEEKNIVDGFIKEPSQATTLDLEAKKKLEEAVSKKNKLLQKDPASLIIQSNDTVKDLYNDYTSETNQKAKQEKFKKYIGAVKEAQINMGLDVDRVKVIPNGQAISLVKQYEDLKTPRDKINFLNSLEIQYGENYGIVLKQLTENKLPVTAKLVSYFGNEVFAEKAFSVDTKEERDRLDNYLKTIDTTKSDVQKAVGDELSNFRTVVMTANPYDTSTANKELDEIQQVMTYLTISEISRGKSLDDAVKSSTKILTDNFELKETYFIPKIYNNQTLSDNQVNFISQKAELIKGNYIDALDIIPFKSNNKKISDVELNASMLGQIKSNGVWLNKADGDGIFLAVKFANGEYGEVLMKGLDGKPTRIEMNFDDGTFLIPKTKIKLDFGAEKRIAETITGDGS